MELRPVGVVRSDIKSPMPLLGVFLLTLFLVLPQAEGRENPFVSKQAPAKEIRLPAFASRLMGQVMLFALSFNLLAVGLIMSLIMALGMAATISLAGVLTILGKEGLLRGLSRKERAQRIVQKSLSILGSLLIIAFGAMLLSTVV